MRPIRLGLTLFSIVVAVTAVAAAADPTPLAGVRRVVFLGDSITYSGQYIEYVDAILRLNDPKQTIELLDLGLPSETVSGLSEPGHAGGSFPRPDLHERLDRVLKKTRPDLVVACYGMNCGMYYPFSEERFKKYQDGIRFLRAHARAVGAKVLHITPPVFDPVPLKGRTLPAGRDEYRQPYEGYNEVLDRYSEWLVSQRAEGWDVLDIHGPLNQMLATRRKIDPNFRFAGDGVHISTEGHWIIATMLLSHWGVTLPASDVKLPPEQYFSARPHGLEVLKLVHQRQRILADAWLTATGHKRPGMTRGLPLEEAERQAVAIDAKIRAIVAP
jgi:lysophospholipase L1-like esterase